MSGDIKQARFDVLVAQAGLTNGRLAIVLGVNQSTVSRLRNGEMTKIDKYIDCLEQYLGLDTAASAMSDEKLIKELVSLAALLPHLRETLVGLHTLMRLSA